MKSFIIVSGAVYIVFCLFFSYSWAKKHNWHFLSLPVAFYLGLAIFYGVGMLSMALNEKRFNIPLMDIALKSVVYVYLGLGCFAIGTRMRGLSGRLAGIIPMPYARPNKIQLTMLIMICLALSTVGFLAFGRVSSVGQYYAVRWLGIIYFSAVQVMAGLAAVYLVTYKPSPFMKLILITIILFAITMNLGGFSRRPLASVLMAVFGIWYHFKLRKAPARKQVLVLITMIFLGMVLANFYGRLRMDYSFKSANIWQWMKETRKIITPREFKKVFSEVRYLNVDTFQVTSFIVQRYPSMYPYRPGMMLWELAVNPIPRLLWKRKPVGFGTVIAQQYYGTKEIPMNLGPGVVGELFSNGGIIMIVIGMMLFGVFAEAVHLKFSRNINNVIFLTLHYVIYVPFLSEARGGFLDMSVNIVWATLLLYILGLVLQVLYGPAVGVAERTKGALPGAKK